MSSILLKYSVIQPSQPHCEQVDQADCMLLCSAENRLINWKVRHYFHVSLDLLQFKSINLSNVQFCSHCYSVKTKLGCLRM